MHVAISLHPLFLPPPLSLPPLSLPPLSLFLSSPVPPQAIEFLSRNEMLHTHAVHFAIALQDMDILYLSESIHSKLSIIPLSLSLSLSLRTVLALYPNLMTLGYNTNNHTCSHLQTQTFNLDLPLLTYIPFHCVNLQWSEIPLECAG